MQLDAVCGKRVRERRQLMVEYAGEPYYFCSLECLNRFDASPDLFTVQAGEGNLTNRDRYLRPGHGGSFPEHGASFPEPGSHAILEPADSDAGPG